MEQVSKYYFTMIASGIKDEHPDAYKAFTATPLGDGRMLFEGEFPARSMLEAMSKVTEVVGALRLSAILGIMEPEFNVEDVSVTYRPARVKQAS